MKAYYNDNSLEAIRWLQWLQLYAAVSPGRLDSRSVHDVCPEDLGGVIRAHFFAGIGGWDYALQLAGWPEDRPVWTASLPCQPFSIAGQQRGTEDERHLWPVFRDLVAQRQPATIFGEQVASPAGRAWLASVQADLEALGYSTAAADLCAAGVGAPHIRQRLYWMAHNETRRWGEVDPLSGECGEGSGAQKSERSEYGSRADGLAQPYERHAKAEGLQRSGQQRLQSQGSGVDSGMGDITNIRCDGVPERSGSAGESASRSGGTGSQRGAAQQLAGASTVDRGLEHIDSRGRTPRHEAAQTTGYRASVESTGGLGDSRNAGSGGNGGSVPKEEGDSRSEWSESRNQLDEPFATGFRVWDDIVFVPCGDGKTRPIKSGLEPLVNGVPNRLGRIRGYGNSIVPQVAAIFIRSVMDVLP